MRINILFDFNEYYYYWMLSLCWSLRRLGIESDFYCATMKNKAEWDNYKYPSADYYIMFNNIMGKDKVGTPTTNLFSIVKNFPSDAKKIWMPSNQIDFDSKNPTIKDRTDYFKRVHEFGVYDYVVATKKSLKDEFENQNLNVCEDIVGFGYSEVLDKYIKNDYASKNIDVHFCGHTYSFQKENRRENILSNLAQYLPIIRDNNIWLEDYYKQLSRSKIELNIHGWSMEDLKTNYEYVRIISSIMQKALVISEPIIDCSPFINNEHIICCKTEEIFEKCRFYLEHEDELKKITDNAFRFWKYNYRMDDLLYNFIVNNIDENFERKNIEVEIPKVKL